MPSDYVRIFDTTLRDGEQSPGAALTIHEKVTIARALERLGVDIIEAGFPISSPGDFKAVQLISQEIRNCTICGLTAGYQGPGTKTVLPAEASAKVDFRLVPNQTPEEVLAKLRSHLDAEGFSDVQVTLMGGEAPGRVDPDDPFIHLTVEAARGVFEHEMVVVPMIGGSGPNHAFIEHLHVPIATVGFGHPGGRVHAPDENIRLDLFEKGIRHTARILALFGAQ